MTYIKVTERISIKGAVKLSNSRRGMTLDVWSSVGGQAHGVDWDETKHEANTTTLTSHSRFVGQPRRWAQYLVTMQGISNLTAHINSYTVRLPAFVLHRK